MKNNQKGITLVALVVTIVVLIILAGISIALVLGNNGVVTKATQGKANYEKAQGEEENTLSDANDWIDDKIGSNTKLPSTDTTKPYCPTGCTKLKNTDLDTGLVVQDANGNQYVWVEVPMTASVYKTAGLGLTDFSDDNYTKIYNDLHLYSEYYAGGVGYNYQDKFISTAQTGEDSTHYYTTKNEMLKSVYQNGGFWVGRYETGDSTATANKTPRSSDNKGKTGTAVVKEDQVPYTYISSSDAEQLSQGFNPDSTKYSTHLMFGVQWNLMLKYLETKGVPSSDMENISDPLGNYQYTSFTITKGLHYDYDNSKWIPVSGSYSVPSDPCLLTTGATTRNARQNIFDFAGNVLECTLEYSDNGEFPSIARGGSYRDDGRYSHSDIHNSNVYACYSDAVGFRVALNSK